MLTRRSFIKGVGIVSIALVGSTLVEAAPSIKCTAAMDRYWALQLELAQTFILKWREHNWSAYMLGLHPVLAYGCLRFLRKTVARASTAAYVDHLVLVDRLNNDGHFISDIIVAIVEDPAKIAFDNWYDKMNQETSEVVINKAIELIKDSELIKA